MTSTVGPATSGGIFDGDKKETEIAELEAKMAEPGFWDDQAAAQKVIGEMNRRKRVIESARAFNKELADLNAMAELVAETEEGSDEAEEYGKELADTAKRLEGRLDQLELESFLSGPLDNNNAYLTIHSGAGGTESCDWAEMLLRMYTRWAERFGFKTETLDMVEGEETGISSVTLHLGGDNAYGYAKAERGVHRLVRISPFDSNSRRHTSFCSVDVVAELEDDIEVDLDESDIRVDVYRASGKGGQHVNRTESAVRLTHLPTGIVVTCQNDRSQVKNKATAMKTLKSRLYEKKQDEKRSEMERFYGEKGEMAWGNQIRSYVFHPYQMVKDLRTGMETGNVQAVMDGELDAFIFSWLRAGGPSSRKAAEDREFGHGG